MPWVTMPHLKGKVYIPEKALCRSAKHPCPDCFACQGCSDERCSACRNQDPKMSEAHDENRRSPDES